MNAQRFTLAIICLVQFLFTAAVCADGIFSLPDPPPPPPLLTEPGDQRPIYVAENTPHTGTPAVTGGVIRRVPTVAVETVAPAEAVVGKVTPVMITVSNLSESAVDEVKVEATIPAPLKLVAAKPAPSFASGQNVQFALSNLPSKGKQSIVLNVMPQGRGSIEIPTKVSFAVASRLAMEIRHPQLAMRYVGPREVIYGAPAHYKVVVTNSGDGPAENVVVSQQFADETVAITGGKNSARIASLPPGQSQEVEFSVVPRGTGKLPVVFAIHGAGDVQPLKQELAVLRPMLQVHLEGPNVTYMNRSGIYAILVTNAGDAPARSVEVLAAIPPGLKLTTVDRPIQVDRTNSMIKWSVPELAPGDREVLRYKADAVREGEQLQEVVANASAGLVAEAKHLTEVISKADLTMNISDSAGPIEVGGVARFEITLANRGTKAARDVSVRVKLPFELEPVDSADYVVNENRELVFPSLILPVGESKLLRFNVVGNAHGDQVVRVILHSDAQSRELIKEQSVFFYESRRAASGFGDPVFE